VVQKALALSLATPSVERRSRDERSVDRAKRAISFAVRTYEAVPNTWVFGKAFPFAGGR